MYRGECSEFRSVADALLHIARLCWQSDAFLAQVLYRGKARLQTVGVPLLPRLLNRLAMLTAQVAIGDPVVIQPGIYILHGQVVIDGMTEIGHGVTIAPFVTIGLRAGDVVGPTDRVAGPDWHRSQSARRDPGRRRRTDRSQRGGDRRRRGGRDRRRCAGEAGLSHGGRTAADPRRPGAPARRVLRPWREARVLRYRSAELPARSWLPWRRRRKRRARADDRPQRARLPADLAALLLALLRRRGHLRARQPDAPTARPTATGSSASRSPTTGSTTRGWSRRSRSFQHRLLERYDVVLVSTSTRSSPRYPSGATLGDYIDRLRRGVRQPARLRGPAPAGPRAAARSGPPDPRPARALVRERRLRQAGAGDRADELGARACTPAPTAGTTSIRTCG